MDKFEQLKIYEAKQGLIGRIFEFAIDDCSKEVVITKYYDVPHRTEIIIPDFVDGFRVRHEDNQYIGAFSKCEHIEKIIMKPNIKGDISNIFNKFRGNKLDLSEFDTSNITNMESMLSNCTINNLILGGKFDTSKVCDMNSMFQYGRIEEITEFNLNTSSVKKMSHMFSFYKTNILDLTNFDTSNVSDMYLIFYGCNMTKLKFGRSFYIEDIIRTDDIFQYSNINEVDIGITKKEHADILLKKLTSCTQVNKLITGKDVDKNRLLDAKLMANAKVETV